MFTFSRGLKQIEEYKYGCVSVCFVEGTPARVNKGKPKGHHPTKKAYPETQTGPYETWSFTQKSVGFFWITSASFQADSTRTGRIPEPGSIDRFPLCLVRYFLVSGLDWWS